MEKKKSDEFEPAFHIRKPEVSQLRIKRHWESILPLLKQKKDPPAPKGKP
ncbi:hypothetical protein [Mucilaginibacter sp. OK283]|nr:hypothetical protein [Mucilaginibacter sp. OK283]